MKTIPSILFALILLSIGQPASAQTDPCAGLSGAAFGLCVAAQASECDGSETDAIACNKIELRFKEMTGTTPPWTLPDCPCGTTADFTAHIKNRGVSPTSCSVLVQAGNNILSIDSTIPNDFLVFTHLPPINFSFKRTCGFDATSLASLDDLQAESCANNIQAAAAEFGLVCKGL